MARDLLSNFEQKNSYHYLKAAEYILGSTSIYDAGLVKEFQVKLIECILDQERNNQELWGILKDIIKGNESLLETGRNLLKSSL
jgi:hypothetical protein